MKEERRSEGGVREEGGEEAGEEGRGMWERRGEEG